MKSIDDAPEIAKNASLIVNATSWFKRGYTCRIHDDQIIYDIVYRPMKTGLFEDVQAVVYEVIRHRVQYEAPENITVHWI